MKYFIRFTDTPKFDLERGVSYHLSDVEADGYEYNEHFGCYAQDLGGLCAYELEAETEEEAIEEASSFKQDIFDANDDLDSFVVLTGEYLDDCPEGVVIKAKDIVFTKKGIYFAE